MRVRVSLGVLAAGALITLGFMLHAGSPGQPSWWLGFLLIGAWSLAPYGVCAAAGRRVSAGREGLVWLAASALLTGMSAALLYDAFVARPDAQSGLVFVFLPLWQLVGLAPVAPVARSLARRAR